MRQANWIRARWRKLSLILRNLKPLFPSIRIELRVMTNAEVRGKFR